MMYFVFVPFCISYLVLAYFVETYHPGERPRPTHGWAPKKVSFSMTLILYLCHCVFCVCALAYFVLDTSAVAHFSNNLTSDHHAISYTINSWAPTEVSFSMTLILYLCLCIFRICATVYFVFGTSAVTHFIEI